MSGPQRVLTLRQSSGRLLISADIHGHWEDFSRLRALFLAAEARGDNPLWVSVGDWVHGPSAERPSILAANGEPLYAYPDDSPTIVRELSALMDAYPERVLSLCGNHEYAHIGGPKTRKFHEDEAAFLEARLPPAEVSAMRARFASWPIAARVPSCGLVITHGAMAPAFEHVAELERIPWGAAGDEVLNSTMHWYSFSPGQDTALLQLMSQDTDPAYSIIVHGHDREESGYARTGDRALLLCTSFGAIRSRKAYLWLDLAKRYQSLDELREHEEIRFLYTGS